MIVNLIPEGWEIIFQRAHGLLASELAQHWRKDQRPERWIETLAAITEHDDSQEPLKGNYHITEAGAPKDFTFQDFSLQHAINISKTSKYKSRWVALLISKHMIFLYGKLRGKDRALDKFLDDQLTAQKEWLKELEVTESSVKRAYNLLQWCDRCSLILTKNELPKDEKTLEVAEGPKGEKYKIFQREDKTINIQPWPFEQDNFKVWVEARELHQLSFKNDEELADALENAKVNVKEWSFKRS